MTPFYADDWLTVYGGDCLEVMATMPADSVDAVVTSPPYWGLRDYGTATWEGGDAECDHIRQSEASRLTSTLGNRPRHENDMAAARTQGGTVAYGHACGKCGAVRIDSQLGLERTPEEYVANMVAVFAEVRRVLKPSGTCWLNLGDSYAAGKTGRTDSESLSEWVVPATGRRAGGLPDKHGGMGRNRPAPDGLKPKDLVGIPWRVAFALQADGWYLRSDIIWSKPNPMPESVTDRPTKSHEYLFLLTKSARYYFDADAVREANVVAARDDRGAAVGPQKYTQGERTLGTNGHNLGALNPAGRNIRSVWTIATRPYPGAHFAVFPPELPERCIKAGSSEKGVCPECGAPWERVVERSGADMTARYERGEPTRHGTNGAAASKASNVGAFTGIRATSGWLSACKCGARASSAPLEAVPAVVLDPFAGSGTVGMVANRLSRRAILIDLNPEYLKQQMKRNAQTPLGLDVA